MIIRKIGENILSPISFTTEENLAAVMAGRSALRRYDSLWGLPFPCFASLIPDDLLESGFESDVEKGRLPMDSYTKFEKVVPFLYVLCILKSFRYI